MPTRAKAAGSMRGSPSINWAAWPKAPPSRPPMASDGAKSPALPPEPMVSDAATSLASDSAASSSTTPQPMGSQGDPEMASWTAP